MLKHFSIYLRLRVKIQNPLAYRRDGEKEDIMYWIFQDMEAKAKKEYIKKLKADRNEGDTRKAPCRFDALIVIAKKESRQDFLLIAGNGMWEGEIYIWENASFFKDDKEVNYTRYERMYEDITLNPRSIKEVIPLY